MASQTELNQIQKSIWSGSLPLEIRLSPLDCRIYDQSDPYLVVYILITCPLIGLDSNSPRNRFNTRACPIFRSSYLAFTLSSLLSSLTRTSQRMRGGSPSKTCR